MHCSRFLRFAVSCALTFAAAGGIALAGSDVCGGQQLLAIGGKPNGAPVACIAAPKTLLVESLYYQNASKVGGTALAAYPMIRLRAGVAPRLELVVDAPSQVAESGLGGAGLYPASSPGIGVNYALSSSIRSALALGAELLPPESLYEPNRSAQPKYEMHLTSAYRVTRYLTLDGALAGSSSRRSGLQRIYPTALLGADLTVARQTRVSFDLGARIVTRRQAWQSFGDISVTRLLGNNLAFDIGLGTAFNPVNDQKSHYLAAGFNVKP
jgi:hypothetical protein